MPGISYPSAFVTAPGTTAFFGPRPAASCPASLTSLCVVPMALSSPEADPVQIELIPRRPYGSGRLDRVIRRPRRLLPALGGPSWSRLCPVCGARVLALYVHSRTLGGRHG